MAGVRTRAVRDTYRARAYRAEEGLKVSEKGWYEPRMLGLMTRVESIVACHPELAWPDLIQIGDGRGCRSAWAKGGATVGQVLFPRWARTALVVCHELAHVIVHQDEFPAHGAEWARVFIYLLDHEHHAGALALRREFEAQRVPVVNAIDAQFLAARASPPVIERM
jgi:hypothetical protein